MFLCYNKRNHQAKGVIMSGCKCIKCGGSDKNVVCEKTMFAMKGAVYIQEKFGIGMFLVAIILASCGIFGFFN